MAPGVGAIIYHFLVCVQMINFTCVHIPRIFEGLSFVSFSVEWRASVRPDAGVIRQGGTDYMSVIPDWFVRDCRCDG